MSLKRGERPKAKQWSKDLHERSKEAPLQSTFSQRWNFFFIGWSTKLLIYSPAFFSSNPPLPFPPLLLLTFCFSFYEHFCYGRYIVCLTSVTHWLTSLTLRLPSLTFRVRSSTLRLPYLTLCLLSVSLRLTSVTFRLTSATLRLTFLTLYPSMFPLYFIYRRPTLYPLEIAVDFFKSP